MNQLTLFGEFVEALRKHVESKGLKPLKSVLVEEITGSGSPSQQARYMREYRGDQGVFFYHRSTIAKMITSTMPKDDSSVGMVRAVATGYMFTGQREDTSSIGAVERAILLRVCRKNDYVRGLLERAPIKPECPFCMTMYKRYDAKYGQRSGVIAYQGGPVVSDLERYVRDIDEKDKEHIVKFGADEGLAGGLQVSATLALTIEIYKRLLSGILLGPEAVGTIGAEGKTAVASGAGMKGVLDGFSLCQMVIQSDRTLVPHRELAFESAARVVVGREGGKGIGYPVKDDGSMSGHDLVSHAHVAIIPVDMSDVCKGWRLEHLSGTNVTVVRHSDGSRVVMTKSGVTTDLRQKDEIWLAPFFRGPNQVDWQQDYQNGAVFKFNYVYDYAMEDVRS